MELDGSLGGTEMRPWEHREAQAYGSGVQCVGGLREFHRKAVVGVGLSCRPNQAHGEIGVDAPVALFVGISQCGTGSPATGA